MKNDDVILKLRDYYKENCEKLVFVGEKRLSTNNNCKMYYLDISKYEEQKNMKKFIGKPDTLVSSKNDEIMEYRYWIDVKKNLSNSNEFILNH